MSDKKIKIFTISDHPLHPSGVAHQTKLMIEGMLKTGKYQFVSFGGAIKHPDYTPISVEEYNGDWIIYPVNGYGSAMDVRTLLRSHKPDILWFMTDPRYFTWLWEIEDEIRPFVPMVYYHVWDNFPAPTFNEPYYSSTDTIVTISKVTDEIVKEVAPDVKRHYLPHSVDTEIFKKLEDFDVKAFKKEHFGDENKFLCFWNNRNARRKQSGSVIFWFKTFLDAVGHDKAVLLMHTETKDPNGQDLEAIVHHLGLLNGEVLFSSQKMPASELSKLYNAADVTINISDAEGFGLSTLESLACETPILVNKTGGLAQQVTDLDGNVLGYGITPSSKAVIGSQQVPFIYEDRISEKDFFDGLKHIYQLSKEERTKLEKLCRKHVIENYNFNDFVQGWDKILQETHLENGSWDNRKNYKKWELLEI